MIEREADFCQWGVHTFCVVQRLQKELDGRATELLRFFQAQVD